MSAKFQPLAIAGVASERCYSVEGSTFRIYLSLTSPPPPGWSYRFALVWQAMEHSAKRPLGIDGDTIWIECPPEEVRAIHLAELEQAIAIANERHQRAIEQKEAALERQRELLRQTQAQLDELADSFVPEEPSMDETDPTMQSDCKGICGFLRRIFATPAQRSSQGRGGCGLMHWKAGDFGAQVQSET